VTLQPSGKSDSITVTVTPAQVPATNVSINGGDKTINIGQEETLQITKTPSNTTDTVSWSSSNSKVTVDQNGKIKGITAGTAEITVTLQPSGKTASITVTVNPNAPTNIPTNGDIFDMVGDEDQSKDYSVDVSMTEDNFDHGDVEPGSIKLSDIIDTSKFGTNFNGVTVTAVPTTLNGKVSKGVDKDGDQAILITYYGTLEDWRTAKPDYPAVQMTLVLHAAGYADTTIKVNLTFIGSLCGWN